MHLSPGTLLDRYVIEGVVGQGARAIVFAVRHVQLGSEHALKVLRVPGRSSVERVMIEGRAQSLLNHPNVVAVTDVIDVWGSPGLVMELIRGPTLADALSFGGFDLDQVDDLARGILAGVASAHKVGLVHRDLKPANILLELSDAGIVPKVTDFGLAKVLGDAVGLTAQGAVLGTPAYMAPEQTEDSSSVDARADVFALGAILYEMVAGRRAFVGDDVGEVIMAVRRGRYQPLEEVVPELPPRMHAAITRALRIDRSQRCQEVAILLSTWMGDPGEHTGRVAPDRVWDDRAVSRLRELWTTRPTFGTGATPTPRPVDVRVQSPPTDPLVARLGVVVAGAAFAGVLGLGVWALGHGSDRDPAAVEAEVAAAVGASWVALDSGDAVAALAELERCESVSVQAEAWSGQLTCLQARVQQARRIGTARAMEEALGRVRAAALAPELPADVAHDMAVTALYGEGWLWVASGDAARVAGVLERLRRLPDPSLGGVERSRALSELERAASGLGGDPYAEARAQMVREQIEARGVSDPEVLRAMRVVPRHRYMPRDTWEQSTADHPVPIGEGQTISQPYIVAIMTELAQVERGDRVLEVGTGSGYQAAVLAELGAEVYSIEILAPLAERAREALDATGYGAVHTRVGDGYAGWPDAAPFDAIVVTAAPGHVPGPLEEQLGQGGVMVIPVGTHRQELTVIERTGAGLQRRSVLPVMFVPMTGEAQR